MFSCFGKAEPKAVKGICPRVRNICKTNFRGLLGFLILVIVFGSLFEKGVHANTVTAMWIVMIGFFLVQPVNIPVAGLIPIFTLPMSGSMSTDKTCSCYMNEGILMFILSNMVLLLWNNSGLDRRLALWFMCSGDTTQFSAKRMVFKCGTGAFFLSMFSNRLIVSSIMTTYVTTFLMELEESYKKSPTTKFNEMRYILNSVIQTSCSIGGTAILHSSFATLTFRALFYQTTLSSKAAWHDIFNYLEYSSFAFPAALGMLIVNLGYHIILMSLKTGEPMTLYQMNILRNKLWGKKYELPKKVTLYEKLTFIWSITSLIVFFFRWNKYVSGWSEFKKHNKLPLIRDATVAAMFVILLHSLPNGYQFMKIFLAKKRSEIKSLKSESGILWWRFVDKNTNYGYFFLIGSGVALSTAIRHTGLDTILTDSSLGKFFGDQPLFVYILLVIIVSVIFANAMTGVAACVVLVPFVMNMHKKPLPEPEEGLAESPKLRVEPAPSLREPTTPDIDVLLASVSNFEKEYLGSLAVGIATSLGFMCPFLYTPAYFCHYVGKVPKKKMAIYGVGSAILCMLVLWLFLAFYAPVLWKSSEIRQEVLPSGPTTTKKPVGEGSVADDTII